MAVIIAKGSHGVLTGTVFVDQASENTPQLVSEATGVPVEHILRTDGTLYAQEAWPELYSVIGKQYGGGPSTFRVPECKTWLDFLEAGNDDIKTPAEWKEYIKDANRRRDS